MKKNYFVLIVLILSTILCSSCSDDNDDWRKTYGLKISKVYRGDNLEMTLSDTIPNGKGRVLLIANEQENAEVVLIHIIPGEDSIVFSNVKLIDMEPTKGDYSFVANHSNSDRIIDISGEIVDSKLKINISPIIIGELVGRWNNYENKTLSFDIVPATENAKINMHGLFGNGEMSLVGGDNSFQKGLPALLNLMFFMLNPSLDLEENGFMTLSWNPKKIFGMGLPIEAGQTPQGYVRYSSIDNNKLYMSFALDSVVHNLNINLSGEIPSINGNSLSDIEELADIDLKEVFGFIQQAYRGLPINYKVSLKKDDEDDDDEDAVYSRVLSLSVSKEMMLPFLQTFLPILKPLLAKVDWENINSQVPIPGMDLGLNAENIDNFLGELVRVMDESPKFDLIIEFSQEIN